MNATDLAKILDELGQRLGPTGEHVFQLAVRQVVIEGVLSAIAAVVLSGIAWLAFGRTRGHRAAAWANWNAHPTNYPSIDHHPNEDLTVLGDSVMGYGIVLLAAVLALASLHDAVSKLLNPEYAALRDILGAIKP